MRIEKANEDELHFVRWMSGRSGCGCLPLGEGAIVRRPFMSPAWLTDAPSRRSPECLASRPTRSVRSSAGELGASKRSPALWRESSKSLGCQSRKRKRSAPILTLILYSSVENHAETQRTQRREERTMTLTSHGNLNLKGVIHHYGDCRTLSVVLVSSEISAFSASLREVIASNEKMNCRIEDKFYPQEARFMANPSLQKFLKYPLARGRANMV